MKPDSTYITYAHNFSCLAFHIHFIMPKFLNNINMLKLCHVLIERLFILFFKASSRIFFPLIFINEIILDRKK